MKQSLQIYQVIAQLGEMKKQGNIYPFELEVENSESFRSSLRAGLRAYPELNGAFSIIANGENKVMITQKQISRQRLLEETLTRALNYIEDENFYEECMEVLYGKG